MCWQMQSVQSMHATYSVLDKETYDMPMQTCING